MLFTRYKTYRTFLISEVPSLILTFFLHKQSFYPWNYCNVNVFCCLFLVYSSILSPLHVNLFVEK